MSIHLCFIRLKIIFKKLKLRHLISVRSEWQICCQVFWCPGSSIPTLQIDWFIVNPQCRAQFTMPHTIHNAAHNWPIYLTFLTDLPTRTTYLTYLPTDLPTYRPKLPNLPTWPTYLPDLHIWPTYLTYLPDLPTWPSYLFLAVPRQLYRWPCHSLSHWVSE